MTCVICWQGETHPGLVTVTLTRLEAVVVIKGVPALVCENCGEYYLTEDVATVVTELAEDAIDKGAEVEVLRYAA
ncbi:MAG: type II toxin-antitoxin system MqsA family antitoxin [Anaerolineae bacterium]